MKCREARLLLQTPHEITRLEMRRLDNHLAGCEECRRAESAARGVDAILQQGYAGWAQGSVRQEVLSKISRGELPAKRGRAGGWLHLAVAFPLAAAALIVLMLASQLVPGAGEQTQPARAAFHPHRPYVGYPLAVDRLRPNHLLAGSGGQVYQSWNGGDSWQQAGALPAHLIIRALAIDASRPDRYLVAVKHSVYVSADAGRHWQTAVTSLRGAENMFLMQDQRDPATFYVGPGVVWRSDDHGASWSQNGAGYIFAPNGVQSMVETPGGKLLTGIWDGGVGISGDGGLRWRRLDQGLDSKVMDVAATKNIYFAATRSGLFRSDSGGRVWHPVRLPGSLFTTAVLAHGDLILAGGNGAMYRSPDGGRHWAAATEGLPLEPYVNSLVASSVPGRIYASLNGDGIFRSDDGGRHWRSVDNGLPLNSASGGTPLLLFVRSGVLWATNSNGTDPGTLSVDQDVRLAQLSPDGGEAAYIAAEPGRWAARIVGTGGSSATTVARGSGRAPQSLYFAPSSSMLAISRDRKVSITSLTRTLRRWKLRRGDAVLGWGPRGRGLLVWQRSTASVDLLGWRSEKRVQQLGGAYPVEPALAPNARSLSFVDNGLLHLAGLKGIRGAVPVPASCRTAIWAPKSDRLALACGRSAQIRSATGKLEATLRLTADEGVRWLPDGRSLVVERRGGLYRVSLSGREKRIVPDASLASTH
ncbi:MAG: hypothetical protein ACRDFS_09195 [Chloroflexota bacterium]